MFEDKENDFYESIDLISIRIAEIKEELINLKMRQLHEEKTVLKIENYNLIFDFLIAAKKAEYN
ncbi:MAG: hypothetical protein CMF23_14480 [Ignavibacteriae bacterium]|nr:hypothetical protein [Ignavibacteriota bacterium]|tara:strand:- start:229 stop:420 length:192 start_codon:yes stop_codon:yes gene_type:complete